jgi:GxxExxY protein
MKDCSEQIIDARLAAAIRVHQEMGPGLVESVYESAMMIELADSGMSAKNQVEIPVEYKGQSLGLGFRADIVVEDCLLLEIKSVNELNELHVAQVINYLKLLRLKRGFLLNFNRKLMKEGIRRVSI